MNWLRLTGLDLVNVKTGIGFTMAREGMPVRVNRLVPGAPASRKPGLAVGLELYAVNGMAIGDRPHANAIAMVKAARWRVAAATAPVPPTRLTFAQPAESSLQRDGRADAEAEVVHQPAQPGAEEAWATYPGGSSAPNSPVMQRRKQPPLQQQEEEEEEEEEVVGRARARTIATASDSASQLLH
jgi:hypothetical protein